MHRIHDHHTAVLSPLASLGDQSDREGAGEFDTFLSIAAIRGLCDQLTAHLDAAGSSELARQ